MSFVVCVELSKIVLFLHILFSIIIVFLLVVIATLTVLVHQLFVVVLVVLPIEDGLHVNLERHMAEQRAIQYCK